MGKKQHYYDALARLVKRGDKPITNDAVALEAGKGRSAIRKDRPENAELIAAIEQAEHERQKKADAKNYAKLNQDGTYRELRAEIQEYKRLYQEALAAQLSLLAENYDLKKKVKAGVRDINRISTNE